MSPWSRSIALGMSTVTSHMQAGALLSTRICEKHVGAGYPYLSSRSVLRRIFKSLDSRKFNYELFEIEKRLEFDPYDRMC